MQHCKVMKVLVTQLCLTSCDPWTIACQAPPSMGFSRQKYWSGLPFLSPEDLPNSGIEPRSSASQADSLPFEQLGKPPCKVTILQLKKKRLQNPSVEWNLIEMPPPNIPPSGIFPTLTLTTETWFLSGMNLFGGIERNVQTSSKSSWIPVNKKTEFLMFGCYYCSKVNAWLTDNVRGHSIWALVI